MKLGVEDLCRICRKIPYNSELTIEQVLNQIATNSELRNLHDDKFNSAIFAALYEYKDIYHCAKCWQVILNLLPAHMKSP